MLNALLFKTCLFASVRVEEVSCCDVYFLFFQEYFLALNFCPQFKVKMPYRKYSRCGIVLDIILCLRTLFIGIWWPVSLSTFISTKVQLKWTCLCQSVYRSFTTMQNIPHWLRLKHVQWPAGFRETAQPVCMCVCVPTSIVKPTILFYSFINRIIQINVRNYRFFCCWFFFTQMFSVM